MTNKTEDRFYFGKPGQPERFAEGGTPIGPSMLQKITSALASNQTVYVSTMTKITKITPKTWKKWEASGRPLFKVNSKGELLMASGSSYNTLSMGPTLLVGITMRNESSRPGQPDKFDASSLERGSFAEASKSPMLGKLLSEKAMPEGGWRAVQVGSDTLVISFEDADLARDFGRRCASKGYSATSPVATTGRYWNVEVKNGGK